MSLLGSSVFLMSALPSASGMLKLVLELSALLLSALLSASGVSFPVPGLSALLSILSLSDMSLPVPWLLALLSMSDEPVPDPGLFPPPFPIWSSLQTPTPIPGRQKLGQ